MSARPKPRTSLVKDETRNRSEPPKRVHKPHYLVQGVVIAKCLVMGSCWAPLHTRAICQEVSDKDERRQVGPEEVGHPCGVCPPGVHRTKIPGTRCVIYDILVSRREIGFATRRERGAHTRRGHLQSSEDEKQRLDEHLSQNGYGTSINTNGINI